MGQFIQKMKLNKKGSGLDIIFIMATLLLAFMIVIIVGMAFSRFDDAVQSSDVVTSQAKSVFHNQAVKFSSRMDMALTLFFVGLCIIAILLSSLVRVRLMFLILYIPAVVFMVIMGGVISNIYGRMKDIAIISVEIAKYTKLAVIFAYLPWFILIFSLILMFVLYKVFPTEQ